MLNDSSTSIPKQQAIDQQETDATKDNTPTDHNKLPTALQLGKRLIANLMPSSAFQTLKIPFPDDEHYLTSADSTYYINERSLTSIAAYSLGFVTVSI